MLAGALTPCPYPCPCRARRGPRGCPVRGSWLCHLTQPAKSGGAQSDGGTRRSVAAASQASRYRSTVGWVLPASSANSRAETFSTGTRLPVGRCPPAGRTRLLRPWRNLPALEGFSRVHAASSRSRSALVGVGPLCRACRGRGGLPTALDRRGGGELVGAFAPTSFVRRVTVAWWTPVSSAICRMDLPSSRLVSENRETRVGRCAATNGSDNEPRQGVPPHPCGAAQIDREARERAS